MGTLGEDVKQVLDSAGYKQHIVQSTRFGVESRRSVRVTSRIVAGRRTSPLLNYERKLKEAGFVVERRQQYEHSKLEALIVSRAQEQS